MLTFRAAALAVASAALVGCGSSQPVVDAVPQTRAAEEAVGEAEQAGAPTHAVAELRTARQKLEQAQAALAADDSFLALRLAEQAEVDAELAEAKSREAVALAAITEVRETIRVLREEIERNRNR